MKKFKQLVNEGDSWIYKLIRYFKRVDDKKDLCSMCLKNEKECVLNDEEICCACASNYKQIKRRIKKEMKQNGNR